MKKVRVLVVDDHPIVREGLKLIFETEDLIEIADEASNGIEALQLLRQKDYDLILLDISMPMMSGLEFLQEKERMGNLTEVVVLTTVGDADIVKKAMAFKIKGFLLKDAKREEMIQTVLAAAKGEMTQSKEIDVILLKEEAKQYTSCEAKETTLTEKELLVLCQVVKGAASKEIAIDLGITERTVKAHLTNIYRKLEVNSRAEAVAFAIIRKIVSV